MSTKIWQAYRCPIEKAAAGVKFLDESLLAIFMKSYHKLATGVTKQALIDSVKEDIAKYNPLNKTPETWSDVGYQMKRRDVLYKVLDKLREIKHNDFLLCGFNVYLTETHAYFIPYGNMAGKLWMYGEGKPEDWPEWFVDYHYQNQTDPPPADIIPYEEYESRAEVWDEVLGTHTGMNLPSRINLRHTIFDIQDRDCWFDIMYLYDETHPFNIEEQAGEYEN